MRRRRGRRAAGGAAQRPARHASTPLRADQLGCYGARAAPPRRRSTRWPRAASASRPRSPTRRSPRPSHASILTGLTPLGHGVRDNGGYVLPRGACAASPRTSAQAGYRTAAFVSGFPLDRRFGFDRGFETYDDHLPRGNDRAAHRLRRALRRRDHRRRAALARRRPPAAGSALLPVGALLRPPRALRAARRARGAVPRGALRRRDRVRGRAARAAAARARGASGRSRGRSCSSPPTTARAWASTARTPTASSSTTPRCGCRGSWPGPASPPASVAGHRRARHRRRAHAARLRGAAGARPASKAARCGRPPTGERMDDAPTYAESLYSEREFGWAPLLRLADRTLQADRGAAPRALRPRQRTPAETHNRAAAGAARVEELRRKLAGDAHGRARRRPRREVDAETAERLAALGYLGGGRGAGAPPAPAGAIPRTASRLCRASTAGMSVARTEPAAGDPRADRGAGRGPRACSWRGARAPWPTRPRASTTARSRDLRRLEKEGALTRGGRRSCSATTCASPGRLARSGARCCSATARENPRFAQPWLSLAEIHVKAKQQRRSGRAPTSTCSSSRPTTSRRCAAWATSRCSKTAPTPRPRATAASSRSTPPTPAP